MTFSLKGRDHLRDKLAKSSSPQDMLVVSNELRAELAELEREHPELEIVTREGGRAGYPPPDTLGAELYFSHFFLP